MVRVTDESLRELILAVAPSSAEGDKKEDVLLNYESQGQTRVSRHPAVLLKRAEKQR